MSTQDHKTCGGTTKDGSPCGARPGKGEEFCYRHRDDSDSPASVISITDHRKAFAAGELTRDEYISWLEGVMLGDVTETKTTSKGDTYKAEAQVKDKLTAGRELRAIKGWRGADDSEDEELVDAIAARVRDKLGIG